MKDNHSVIYYVSSRVPHFNLSFHIIHDSITRTPEELQRAMINIAPWSRSKHHRFDPQFRSLVFELLCIQQSLAIPLEVMESIVLAWSMVRKYKMVIGKNENVQDEEYEEYDEEDDEYGEYEEYEEY